MSRQLDDLPACSACGGKLFPLVLCDACGAATILRSAKTLDWAAACSECGTFNPWQLICDQCHSRFPATGVAAGPPPAVEASAPITAVVAGSPGRLTRRIKGDVDTRALVDMMKVVGLDPSRAQALIDRGYDALWKIGRATEKELARIPEVGPVAARKVVASFHLLNYAPPQRTKESTAQDEYECPLCRCLTSAFASTCPECGAAFDEEEMDEAIRREFAEAPNANLLRFYEGRLAEKPDDPELLYARGLLLESLGRIDEAVESLDRAAAKAPDAKKIRVAQLRIQAKQPRRAGAAAKLRSTASALLDDVAWDQEVAQLDELISTAEPVCPQCGATVPKDAVLCPSCAARLPPVPEGPGPRPPAPTPEPPKSVPSPELDALVDDLLVGELEESLSEEDLERTKAAVLDWLIAELEDSMAPDAQVVLPPEKRREKEPAGAASPLTDSAGFLSGWMRGSRGLVSGVRVKKAARGGGKVNGLVNGRGRVNGLVNGLGRTNGLVQGEGRVNGLVRAGGRVNGLVTARGRVNGLAGGPGRINGIVNGTPVSVGTRRLRLPAPSKRVRYAAIASATLVAVVIVGLLVVPVPSPTGRIAIDGSFDDWASVPMFSAATVASNNNVSIARYAGLVDGGSLYLFAATVAGTFADATGYDGIYFLIDGDGIPSTGFSFDGIGADTLVEVFGGNHQVDGAQSYSFPAGAEVNWSERQSRGSVSAAASALGLEVKLSTDAIDRFNATNYRISLFADDYRSASSRSTAFLTNSTSAILLEVHPLSSIVGSTPSPLFELRVRSLGLPTSATWDVSNFTINATVGVSVFLSPESVTLTQGRPNATILADVSAPGFFPGDTVEVAVTGAHSSMPVFVRAAPVRSYVGGPPAGVRIDGLFGDWSSRDNLDTDATPVNNPDLDIHRYGAATSNATAFFHVRVGGVVFDGGIPERLVRPSPSASNGSSGGGSTSLPRRTGEDVLLVYVDANRSDSQGLDVGGIFADYLVEIRGEGGRIVSRDVYAWSNRWVRQAGISVSAEKNQTDIEASVPLPSLNGTRIVIESTSWASVGDTTISVGAPSFAPPSGFGPTALTPTHVQPTSFGGSPLYLRDSDPAISPSDCSVVKGLSPTAGNGSSSLTLDSGSKACFFTDPAASPESVHAGPWSATLDLTTVAGTTFNITFVVTDSDGLSPSLVCSLQTSTTGGTNQGFSCSGGPTFIGIGKRVRLRIEFVSGEAIGLSYDGSGVSQDSSLTIPASEFGDVAVPAAVTGVLVLLMSRRRRRRSA